MDGRVSLTHGRTKIRSARTRGGKHGERAGNEVRQRNRIIEVRPDELMQSMGLVFAAETLAGEGRLTKAFLLGQPDSMDVMTPTQRSRCMSRIRGMNTKPELALRRALWRRGGGAVRPGDQLGHYARCVESAVKL